MMKFQATVFFVASLLTALNGQDPDALNQQYTEKLLLREYGIELKEIANDFARIWEMALSPRRLFDSANDFSPDCLMAIRNYTEYEKDSKNLSLISDLVDAGGKLGAGVLMGNYFLDGAFDECLGSELEGKAKYCTAPLYSAVPFPLRTAFCIPMECTAEDVSYLVSLTKVLSVNESDVTCLSFKTPPYHWTAICMIIFCVILGCVIVAATMADLLIRLWNKNEIQVFLGLPGPPDSTNTDSDMKPLLPKPFATAKKPKKFDPVEWVQAFSLYKTVPTVLSTKQTSAAITCLNGIRVISMFWVILGHVHLVVSLYGIDNGIILKDVMGRFSFQAVGNAFFSVDSFFLLSGVLLAYLTFRQMKRHDGRFPFVMFYVHRYLRLTPVYAFVLFFVWFLSMHLADGPNYVQTYVDGPMWNNCANYWWTNLLYINNLYPWKLTEECLEWSWYLANDMQFFIISPIILIPMYFLFPVGVAIAGVLLFISFVVTASLTGAFDLQPNTFAAVAYGFKNVTVVSTDVLYTKPYHRIQPYLVGLVLGYLLYKKVRIPFNRFFKLGSYLIMWALAFIFCFSTVYGLYNTWHGHIPSLVENIFYNTFSRFVWAVGLALLVFICHNGYGGCVNSFLSMSFWIPLSRLTFNAYLIHPVVVLVLFGSARKTAHYMDISMAAYAIASVVLSFGAAFIFAVCVEFPFGNLEMAFFKIFGVGNRESTRADTEAKHDENVTASGYATLSEVKKNIQ